MIKLDKTLILASGSKARAEMLRGAGLAFETMPADIDECAELTHMANTGMTATQMATALAKQKALVISTQNPDAIVIGSDQVLEFDGEILSKSSTIEGASAKLKMLRGHDHTLISAVSLAVGGQELWSAHDTATLSMHNFDDEFLRGYLLGAGEALTSAVGGYHLEDIGAWLFSEVKGDYFTILGMPLLPLLSYLQENYKHD